jgi:hypothetical protein
VPRGGDSDARAQPDGAAVQVERPTDGIATQTHSHREVVDPDTALDTVVVDRLDRGLPRAVPQQDDAVGVHQYGRRRQRIEYCA